MKRFSSDKAFNQFCQEMSQEGWDINRTNGGHLKWVHPSGAVLHTASTPSCHRQLDNVKRDMRKAFMKVGIDSRQRTPFQQQLFERKIARREERANASLTHRLPLKLPKETKSVHAQTSIHKEKIFIKTAHKKMLELIAQGKSPHDAATVVHSVFMVISPVSQNTAMTLESLAKVAADPTWGARKKKPETVEEKPALAPPPPAAPEPVKEAAPHIPRIKKPKIDKPANLTSAQIDEKLRHVRAVIDMPFDKNKKLEIIIDLLHAML